MAFAFTVKLPDGSQAKGNISTNSSRVALSRLAQEMTANLTPEEIDGFTEVKLRMIGANDSFRRVAAPAEDGEGTAPQGSAGNSEVAARQAATRTEKKGTKK